MDFLKVLAVLLALGSILFLSYVTTRFVGTKARRVMTGKYISIIETVNIGMDKQLHLVKVGDQFVLIASAGKSVEFLSVVNIDNYDEEAADRNPGTVNFKLLFDKYVQLYKDRKEEKKASQGTSPAGEVRYGEVFRSNLEKLKKLNKEASHKGKADENEITDEK